MLGIGVHPDEREIGVGVAVGREMAGQQCDEKDEDNDTAADDGAAVAAEAAEEFAELRLNGYGADLHPVDHVGRARRMRGSMSP